MKCELVKTTAVLSGTINVKICILFEHYGTRNNLMDWQLCEVSWRHISAKERIGKKFSTHYFFNFLMIKCTYPWYNLRNNKIRVVRSNINRIRKALLSTVTLISVSCLRKMHFCLGWHCNKPKEQKDFFFFKSSSLMVFQFQTSYSFKLCLIFYNILPYSNFLPHLQRW